MSIDARVKTVIINENGSGSLLLVDRPPTRKGDTPGIAGQKSLRFSSGPEEVTALNGLNIWGGDSCIMLGEREIARRQGYGDLVFVDSEKFKAAVGEYHNRER